MMNIHPVHSPYTQIRSRHTLPTAKPQFGQLVLDRCGADKVIIEMFTGSQPKDSDLIYRSPSMIDYQMDTVHFLSQLPGKNAASKAYLLISNVDAKQAALAMLPKEILVGNSTAIIQGYDIPSSSHEMILTIALKEADA
jgi:hypothetical protein